MKVLVAFITLFVLGNSFPFDFKLPVAEMKSAIQRHLRAEPPNPQTVANVLRVLGDTNRDGNLSSAEITNFLVLYGSMPRASAGIAAKAFVTMADTDGNRLLNRSETLTLARLIIEMQG